MKDPNYAPVYCALYPELAAIARKHGYAMAVHGSLARDFDLLCFPWQENPNTPQMVVDEITKTFAIRQVGEPDTTHHGRVRFIITVAFGECFLDLQFSPQLGEIVYQSRRRHAHLPETIRWSQWESCTEDYYRSVQENSIQDGFRLEARKLYTAA